MTPRDLSAFLLRVVDEGLRLSLMIWGPPGVGKSSVVAQVAAARELDFVELPAGAIREPTLEHLSVEEIYSLLPEAPARACPNCMRPMGGEGPAAGRLARLEAYWRAAMTQAAAVQRQLGAGDLPAGVRRHVEAVTRPRIDWRSALWRFLVRTPTDFQGFDRRFMHRGLYLEALDGLSVRVAVAIDTSGSIGDAQLSAFLGELGGILGTYPDIEVALYYADAALHGPYPLRQGDRPPPPEGGGGTSFVPFFDALEDHPFEERLAVYFTDGFGRFPERAPERPVLWVVVAGGARDEAFPFGLVTRLVSGD